ncbi:type IV secretory pathway VirB2 component (pilin) [Bifidobacterium commune]|uniref:Uncharacterized protein n=1 Tax=Bifidobacterium commune TaxID=1505727 RepID=A0A1C4H2Y3_9BIFI|nr:hypothetical protein [Bifidobacterium commune]MBB2954868.1 type IV secretory pathway VirB2 component (pilin) [Bifidobacterium commune]SCC78948.1 hypothetical protein GA0061077_0502 [Bifidobacterium commune]
MFQYVLYGCIAVILVLAVASFASAGFSDNKFFRRLKIIFSSILLFFAAILVVASFLT